LGFHRPHPWYRCESAGTLNADLHGLVLGLSYSPAAQGAGARRPLKLDLHSFPRLPDGVMLR
jgi:hypothetical protein